MFHQYSSAFTLRSRQGLVLNSSCRLLFSPFRLGNEPCINLYSLERITFSLTRRERALLDLAALKATAVSIYVSSREWVPHPKRREFSKRQEESLHRSHCRVKRQLEVLLHRIAMHLAHEQEDVNLIYQEFDTLYRVRHSNYI